MNRSIFVALALATLPVSAMAMPDLGAVVGTNATDATTALAQAGCQVTAFEDEGGMIEAQCTEVATSNNWDIVIDPATGAVTEMRNTDD